MFVAVWETEVEGYLLPSIVEHELSCEENKVRSCLQSQILELKECERRKAVEGSRHEV
jgi:hypothetical protein